MSLIKTFSKSFFTSILLIGMTNATAASSLKVENAWSPEAPPVTKVMAGYMKIHNLSGKDIKILFAKSSLFKNIEIHLTEIKNGMMRMVKQNKLNIKAKGHIELKPGGLHMMLIGKLKPISSGSFIPITISFDNGETMSVNLEVRTDRPSKMKCGSGKCGSM